MVCAVGVLSILVVISFVLPFHPLSPFLRIFLLVLCYFKISVVYLISRISDKRMAGILVNSSSN